AAQEGPVDVVTVDGNGVLGRQQVATAASVENVRVSMNALSQVTEAQFNSLENSVFALDNRVTGLEFQLEDLDDRMRGGIASAMAMGGPAIAPGKKVSLSLSVANYRGEQAIAGNLTGEIGQDVYLSAGISGNTAQGDIGTRATVLFGF
ncbi:MAG: YadA C-terminal domain-containing protein, partial [Pseudomonadota bacterium]